MKRYFVDSLLLKVMIVATLCFCSVSIQSHGAGPYACATGVSNTTAACTACSFHGLHTVLVQPGNLPVTYYAYKRCASQFNQACWMAPFSAPNQRWCTSGNMFCTGNEILFLNHLCLTAIDSTATPCSQTRIGTTETMDAGLTCTTVPFSGPLP